MPGTVLFFVPKPFYWLVSPWTSLLFTYVAIALAKQDRFPTDRVCRRAPKCNRSGSCHWARDRWWIYFSRGDDLGRSRERKCRESAVCSRVEQSSWAVPKSSVAREKVIGLAGGHVSNSHATLFDVQAPRQPSLDHSKRDSTHI